MASRWFSVVVDCEDPANQESEVERLISLGARRVDVGQSSDASWVVLADPEDNAFCVLAPQKGWDAGAA
jgi:Glyoxalase-like domain